MEDTLDSSIEKEETEKRPPCWMVWAKTISGQNIIMAICDSEFTANRYRKYIKAINDHEFEMYNEHKYARIWIEKTIMNHLISVCYEG